jgi:hypothetical protein
MKKYFTLALLLLIACNDSTGGHLISVPFVAGGVERDTTEPLTFSTTSGWSVTLDTAVAALGPFYFNIQPPDPDFFRSGVVIMQATEQVVIDAMNPTLQNVPGGADGETGHAVAVEIDFYSTTYQYNQTIALNPPLLGPDVEGVTANGTAYVAGTATKNGMVVPFAGRIVIDSNALTASIPIEAAASIAGAVCDLNFAPSTKAIALRVDPRLWFSAEPNFCSLVPGSSGATCEPVAGTTYNWTSDAKNPTSEFNAAMVSGLKSSTGAYTFALE